MKKRLLLIGLITVLVLGVVGVAKCKQKPVTPTVASKTSAQDIYVTKVFLALRGTKTTVVRFSPDSTKILFCDKRKNDKDFNVYIMGLTEWDWPEKVFDSGTDDLDAFYIDNNSIIVRTAKGIIKVNLKTGEKAPLITGKVTDMSLSSDGSLLAYLSKSKSGLDEVYVKDLKKGEERQLTFSDNWLKEWNKKMKEWELPFHVREQINYGPMIFGKDNSIYFRRPMSDAPTFNTFWNVNLDGLLSEYGSWGGNFSFSPDYKWLCYWDGGHGMPPTVFITLSKSVNYNERKMLVEFKGCYSNPVWSPDGSKIVLLEENDKEGQNILIVTLAGDAISSMSKR